MKIASTKLIYFSPTGTTKKVIENIALGSQFVAAEHVDLTMPPSGIQQPLEMHNELAILGSPVYAGRLPANAISRFRQLKGNNTPTVIVVVYGNRAYEDALLELRNLALELGFKPIAAGAFIGEHSYSNKLTPVAVGRPDISDLIKAVRFGKAIHEKLRNIRKIDQTIPLKVPGNFPYKELRMLSGIAPVTEEIICSKCGTCASICPTAAISVGDKVVSDSSLCIRCCACIKSCPSGARIMEDQRVRQLADWLTTNCGERKEPEIYMSQS
jgi:ferredoxin/flavodoxin